MSKVHYSSLPIIIPALKTFLHLYNRASWSTAYKKVKFDLLILTRGGRALTNKSIHSLASCQRFENLSYLLCSYVKPNIGCRQDEDVSSFENAISQARLFCTFIAHNWSFQNARVSIVEINDMLLVICGTQTPIIFVSGSSATYLCQTPINPRNSHYVISIIQHLEN